MSRCFSKDCKFNGKLTFKLNENNFMVYPTSFVHDGEDLGVLVDISDDKFNKSTLKICITKILDESVLITLKKVDIDFIIEDILSILITMDSNDLKEFGNLFPEQSREAEYNELSQYIYISGKYTVTSCIEMAEAVFKIGKMECMIITNPETNVYQLYLSIIANRNYVNIRYIEIITEFTKDPSDFYIYLQYKAVDKSMKFCDFDLDNSIVIDVCERCQVSIDLKPPVELPWNDNYFVFVENLSRVHNINPDSITIYQKYGGELPEGTQLNINNFKEVSDGGVRSAKIRCDISSKTIKCSSLMNDRESFTMSITPNCTVAGIRRRFWRRFNVDERCFILTQDNKIMRKDSKVLDDQEIQFCIASFIGVVGIDEILGSGTFGKVYRYEQPQLNEVMALKKYTFRFGRCTDFIREFLVLTKINKHANIVNYLGVYADDNNDIFLGMEYVAGGSLKDHLKVNGPMDEVSVKRMALHILNGLKHLHGNKVNHRDVKGANVLLGNDMTGKLCDFGLSKVLECGTDTLSRGLTQTAETGSLNWMAPENLNGDKYTLKADIWSVGATIVEMITGKDPFDGCDEDTIMTEIGIERRIVYSSPGPITEELTQFVQLCLTPYPSERPKVDRLLLDIFFQ